MKINLKNFIEIWKNKKLFQILSKINYQIPYTQLLFKFIDFPQSQNKNNLTEN